MCLLVLFNAVFVRLTHLFYLVIVGVFSLLYGILLVCLLNSIVSFKQGIIQNTNSGKLHEDRQLIYHRIIQFALKISYGMLKKYSWRKSIEQQVLTGVPLTAHWWAARIFKTYNYWLVRGTDLFLLCLSNQKLTTAEHNNSHPVWINQNYTCLFQIGKKVLEGATEL